jgi:hypothetical protein
MTQHESHPYPPAAPVAALPPRTSQRRIWAAQRDLVRESLIRFPQRPDRRPRP